MTKTFAENEIKLASHKKNSAIEKTDPSATADYNLTT